MTSHVAATGVASIFPPQTPFLEQYKTASVQAVALTDAEMFTFILHPEASATNNEAERSLGGAAMDRRTGRTSKTPRGARRRTILMSVLEALTLHLPTFALPSVLGEIKSWTLGESLFPRMLTSGGLDPPMQARMSHLRMLTAKPSDALRRIGQPPCLRAPTRRCRLTSVIAAG